MPKYSRWSERRLSPQRRDEWRALLSAQNGVVHVRQLRAFSISRGVIQANLEAQRWRRVLRGVYATFTGPLNYAAKVSAALLYGGPSAVLSHQTAAQSWETGRGGRDRRTDDLGADEGDDDGEWGEVAITVPYGHSAISQLPLVRVHRSRAMRYITSRPYPERTTRVATLVDIAVAQPDASAAATRLISLAGRWPVPTPRIWRHLERRPPYRYRRALNQAVRLVADGIQSALEHEYHQRIELAHGVPEGLRQQPVTVDGRTLYEDVTYDHLGAPLTVRTDGRTWHATPGVAFRDRRRDNAAELAGRSRLVYGWHEIRNNPCGVASEIATILQRYNVTLQSTACTCCAVSPAPVSAA